MRGSKLSKNIDPHHGRGCKTNFFGTSDSISAEGYPRQIDKLWLPGIYFLSEINLQPTWDNSDKQADLPWKYYQKA